MRSDTIWLCISIAAAIIVGALLWASIENYLAVAR